jgi:adenylylsulfate kinase-like enzyme
MLEQKCCHRVSQWYRDQTIFYMLTDIKAAGRKPEAEEEARPGRVFWITGLSGAGKTTLGRELWSRLRAAGRPATFLAGDALRAVIAEDLDHSAGHRRRSAMRNARCAPPQREKGNRNRVARTGAAKPSSIFDGLMTKPNTTPN